MVMRESGGNTWATRAEFVWGVDPSTGKDFLKSRWRYFVDVRRYSKSLTITYETEYCHQATSWGLGQVMGSVAREHGFDDHLPMLCIPEIGLKYMCKHIKRMAARYETNTDIISAYNAGGVTMDSKTGMYKNQEHVNAVMLYFRTLNDLK